MTSSPFRIITSCSIVYVHPPDFTTCLNLHLHNLASTCSHLPPDFFPLFNLLSPSLSRSLFLHLSQQTFSNSLSCKLGPLSSLILRQVCLPRSSLYLPIQPTLVLKRACSPCVRNKSRSVHFRVKWDYSAAAFISFCWVFSCAALQPVVFVEPRCFWGGGGWEKYSRTESQVFLGFEVNE